MRFLGALAALAIFSASPARAATQWVQQDAEVTYKVVHPFHKVDGVSHKVEVTAIVDGDMLKVMARAPVASFDSGNGNRDAHMQEVTEAPKFPYVTVRILAPKFVLPAPGATQEVTLPGEVELHGIKMQVPVKAKITSKDTDTLTMTFELVDSLDAHHVERPALLFKKLEDAVHVIGTITMHTKAP